MLMEKCQRNDTFLPCKDLYNFVERIHPHFNSLNNCDKTRAGFLVPSPRLCIS